MAHTVTDEVHETPAGTHFSRVHRTNLCMYEYLLVVSPDAVVLCSALGCGTVDLQDVVGGEAAMASSPIFCHTIQLHRLKRNRRRMVESYLRTSLPVLDEVEASACMSAGRIYLLPPHPGLLHYALCFASARHAHWEVVRQYRIRCQMAVVQTMGGGWASVRNAKEALRCSLQLYGLAVQLGDEATKRKCRVFVGWALLWEHQRLSSIRAKRRRPAHMVASSSLPHRAEALLGEALSIFEQQMAASERECDESNRNRCFAALYHWSFLSSTQEDQIGSGERSGVVDRRLCDDPAEEVDVSGTAQSVSGGEGQVDLSNDVLDEWSHVFQ